MCPGYLLSIVASLVADGGPSKVEWLVSMFGKVKQALFALRAFRGRGAALWDGLLGVWHVAVPSRRRVPGVWLRRGAGYPWPFC